MASFVNPVRPMLGSFVPFNALRAGDEYGFLKYFDDYYNFVDGPAASKTLFPLYNATHWIDDLLSVKGLNVYEPVAQVFKAASVDLVGGLDSHSLHLVSLGVHTLNALMLSYWLSLLLLDTGRGRSPSAMLVALLFWLHPLNAEVVGWLSAQNYLFSMVFSLALMIRIETLTAGTPLVVSLVAIILFLLAAFSKASAITIIPLAIARLIHLHQRAEYNKRVSKLVVIPIIMLLVLADFGVVYSVQFHNFDSEQQYPETSLINLGVGGMLRAGMTVTHFLRRMLVPSDLSAHYQFARFGELQSIYYFTLADVDVDPFAIMSVALLLAVSSYFFATFRRDPLSACGWMSFLICWTPTCGILQHGDGSQFGANRYMYFPMAFGLAPLCASIFQKVWCKSSNSARGLCAAVAFMSLGFSYVGNTTLATWKDDKALLRNCLKMDATDLVCLRFSAEYVGNYENNYALATQYRKKEYDLLSSSTFGISFNDLLYLGHLHLLFQEGNPACEKFKEAYGRGLPPLGPRNQGFNNYMMAKVNAILCFLQEGNTSAAELEMATIKDEDMEKLRSRIKKSASSTLLSIRAFLDPTSGQYKKPFYAEYLH